MVGLLLFLVVNLTYRVPHDIPPHVGHIILALLHEGNGAGINRGVLADFLFSLERRLHLSHFFLFCFKLTPGQAILRLRAY